MPLCTKSDKFSKPVENNLETDKVRVCVAFLGKETGDRFMIGKKCHCMFWAQY